VRQGYELANARREADMPGNEYLWLADMQVERLTIYMWMPTTTRLDSRAKLRRASRNTSTTRGFIG